MFKNVNKKIKSLATFYAIAGIVFAIVVAVLLFKEADDSSFILGLIILGAGLIALLIASFALYGFGELLGQVSDIEDSVKKLILLNINEKTIIDAADYKTIIKNISDDIVNEYINAVDENSNNEDNNDSENDDIVNEYIYAINEDNNDEDNNDSENDDIPREDECPCCFHKITKGSKECPYCGYKLERH